MKAEANRLNFAYRMGSISATESVVFRLPNRFTVGHRCQARTKPPAPCPAGSRISGEIGLRAWQKPGAGWQVETGALAIASSPGNGRVVDLAAVTTVKPLTSRFNCTPQKSARAKT